MSRDLLHMAVVAHILKSGPLKITPTDLVRCRADDRLNILRTPGGGIAVHVEGDDPESITMDAVIIEPARLPAP